MNPNLEELPGPSPEEEPEKAEEIETHVKKGVEESVPVEDEMLTSRSLVLKTNRFPTVLGRILSFLDSRSVKMAALVSR